MSTPPPNFDPAALYASVDGRMAGLGTDEVVFFDSATGRSQVMTRDVAQAFGLCRGFAPVQTHIERIIAAIPALKGQAEAVRRVLGMLLANGLMQSDAQFRARFQDPAETARAPVSGLFLEAPEDSAQLQARLDALAAHAARFGLDLPVFVLDLLAATPERAQRVAQFAQASGVAARHVDARAADALVQRLVEALPQHESAVRWLLTAQVGSSGAARNLAALLGAGTRYLFIAADMALPLLRPIGATAGLYADARALSLRSFASLQALADDASEAPQDDPLAAHLALCGLSLAGAMAKEPAAALQADGMQGVVPARVPWLAPGQRVACTSVGWAGRAGAADPCLPFKLDPQARAALVDTREDYLANYRNPILWHGPIRHGVGLGEGLVPLAFDAAQLLPCTLPDAPQAAGLQLELLRLADPGAIDLDLPQALARVGSGAAEPDDELGRPDLAQCLSGLAQVVGQDLYGEGAGARLGVLAAKLADLAAADGTRLQGYLVEYLAWYRSNNIEVMQNTMAAGAPAPVYWVADLRSAVEAQGRALIGGEIPRLAGWPAGLDAEACVARFRSSLQHFADGLRAWPEVFELARARSAEWRDGLR